MATTFDNTFLLGMAAVEKTPEYHSRRSYRCFLVNRV